MNREILGYTKEGEPIYPIKPGMIATAAIISCIKCRVCIRSAGGPMHGATCVKCAELKAQQEPVAWRVTGAGGLTVTPEYPKWAEDDSRLLIESLYTAPQPAPAQDVAQLPPLGEASAAQSAPIDVFEEGQWWLVELDSIVANGTPDQKRAMAVVRNLLSCWQRTQSAGVLGALREAVEYLDDNPFNEIGADSILHWAMRDALAAALAAHDKQSGEKKS